MAHKPQKFVHMEVDPATITLAEAAAWLLQQHKKGAICPCCTQFAKRYKRKLNSSMAYALLLIFHAFRTRTVWLHVPEYLMEVCKTGPTVRGGDWAKLIHWGLIEQKPDEMRQDGSKRTGFYKITDKGNAFVRGEIRVPKYVYIYASRCVGASEETVSFREALGRENGFRYDELMATQ